MQINFYQILSNLIVSYYKNISHTCFKNYTIIFFFVIIFWSPFLYAQQKENFSFKGNVFDYYVTTKDKKGHKFPNYLVNLVLIKDSLEIDNENLFYGSGTSNKYSFTQREYTFYLVIPELKNDKMKISFLQTFLDKTFEEYFFDRNRIHLYFDSEDFTLDCKSLVEMKSFIAAFWLSNNDLLLNCDGRSIFNKDDTSRLKFKKNSKASSDFENITIKKMELEKKRLNIVESLDKWKGTYFISITNGYHTIAQSKETDFDEETLVDLTAYNSIWQLNAGYMFHKKIGGFIDFGFQYKRNEERDFSSSSNGIQITGTGTGAGLFKIGLGGKFIPFANKNWSIYSDISGGFLSVTAGGGSGNASITSGGITNTRNTVEKNERTNYFDFKIGANYRLGRIMYITSNFQYLIAEFDNPIGSITGFTGYTLNLGVGFSFN